MSFKENDFVDSSILNGVHGCACALPALTGSTECCKHCTNNPFRYKDLDVQQSFITTTTDVKIEPYINYPESMMYVLPKNIFDLMELLGDIYNITIYRIKELDGQKYFVVGLKMKEPGDNLKDAIVNINFLSN